MTTGAHGERVKAGLAATAALALWAVPAVPYRGSWTLVVGVVAGVAVRGLPRLATVAVAAAAGTTAIWLTTSPIPALSVVLATVRLAVLMLAGAAVSMSLARAVQHRQAH